MNCTKITFHIGANKTATTAIQSHLDANHDSLLEQGILVMTPDRMEKSDDRIRAIFGRHKPLKKNRIEIFNHKWFQIRAKNAYFWDLVKEKSGSSYPQKIIVSEECLMGDIFKKDTFDLYPDNSYLVSSKKILGSTPDEIHLTIRSYDTFLVSAWASNVLHSKRLQPPFESIRKVWCTSVPRGWVDVITDIKKIFPESRLMLSVYEHDSMEKRLKSIVGPDISLKISQHSKLIHMRPTVEAINARHVEIRNHYPRTPGYELMVRHANGEKFDVLTKQEKTLLASRYDKDMATLKKHDNIYFLNSP